MFHQRWKRISPSGGRVFREVWKGISLSGIIFPFNVKKLTVEQNFAIKWKFFSMQKSGNVFRAPMNYKNKQWKNISYKQTKVRNKGGIMFPVSEMLNSGKEFP